MLIKFLIITSFSLSCFADNIKVMVIDTGTDLSHPEIVSHIKSRIDTIDYKDDHGHGTAIAGLVLDNTCPEIELVSCRYVDLPGKFDNISNTIDCYKRALVENIDYINYSSSGGEFRLDELNALKALSDKGVIIAVAAGNNGQNLINEKTGVCDKAYPGCFLLDNVYIVQNVDTNGKRYYNSNYINHPNARSEMGVDVFVMTPKKGYTSMTGTSPATAKYMNSLLLKRCLELEK